MRCSKIAILWLMSILMIDIRLMRATVTGFFQWSENGRPFKSDVLCPNFCENEDTENGFKRCCACFSKPTWEILPSSALTPISFEKLDISGKNTIRTTNEVINDDTLLSFVHRGAFLTKLPENLCDFRDSLVLIDVSYNELTEIGHLNCLWKLDTLILSHNKLTFISNTTFHNMTNLRIVDVSHNQIKSLDPGLFYEPAPSIYHADFSFNFLKKIDISNVLFPNATFCTLNFSNAVFGDFTNDFDLVAQENESLGCGIVIFDNCLLSETHMNSNIWRNVINDDLSNVWKPHLEGVFTYRNVSIPCDCTMGEIFTIVDSGDFFRLLTREERDAYVCRSPKNMEGLNLTLVNELDLFDLFVCNESIYCPENCTCFEQPSQHRFVVNCSYQNHTKLPTRLPLSKYPYHLDFSYNEIKHLDTRSYISNASYLFLEGNEILELDSSFVEALENIKLVTLNQHELRSIPKKIVKIDANKFIFGKNSIPCTCSTEWLTRWRTYSKVNKTGNPLFCRNIAFGIKHAEEVFDYLDCSEHVIHYQIPILITLMIVISVVSISLVFLKDELMVMKSKLARLCKCSKRNQFMYDVFISFDENSVETRIFAIRFLRSFLIKEGYSVKTPCLDLPFGDTKETEILKILSVTRTFIIIISKNYGKDEESTWNKLEYERALTLYLNKSKNNLILVNFEGLKITNTSLPFLKALYRVNGCLHVADRTRCIYSSIKDKCGQPIVSINKLKKRNFRDQKSKLESNQLSIYNRW